MIYHIINGQMQWTTDICEHYLKKIVSGYGKIKFRQTHVAASLLLKEAIDWIALTFLDDG
jgi:hypothetical protein